MVNYKRKYPKCFILQIFANIWLKHKYYNALKRSGSPFLVDFIRPYLLIMKQCVEIYALYLSLFATKTAVLEPQGICISTRFCFRLSKWVYWVFHFCFYVGVFPAPTTDCPINAFVDVTNVTGIAEDLLVQLAWRLEFQCFHQMCAKSPEFVLYLE